MAKSGDYCFPRKNVSSGLFLFHWKITFQPRYWSLASVASPSVTSAVPPWVQPPNRKRMNGHHYCCADVRIQSDVPRTDCCGISNTSFAFSLSSFLPFFLSWLTLAFRASSSTIFCRPLSPSAIRRNISPCIDLRKDIHPTRVTVFPAGCAL